MNDNERTRLRRQKVGMVFQTFNLMPTLTGVENVSLPLRLNGTSAGEAYDRARKLLDRVGLTDRQSHLPDEMSGGERQRVAIARALGFDPPVLVADEPTGDLDTKSADEVLTLMEILRTQLNKTIIMVTHDPKAAARAQRILHLEKGALVLDTAAPNIVVQPGT